MIIVKELRDVRKWSEHGYIIDFGLGEDGALYFCSRNPITGTRTSWESYATGGFGLTIGEMKKIVKAFGHLGVWL